MRLIEVQDTTTRTKDQVNFTILFYYMFVASYALVRCLREWEVSERVGKVQTGLLGVFAGDSVATLEPTEEGPGPASDMKVSGKTTDRTF